MRNKIVGQDLLEIVSENLPWENLKGASIIVTGAAGILPSYMVETLLYLNDTRNFNIKVTGIIRNVEKARNRFANYVGRNDLTLISHDIRQPFTFAGNVDYIIHAAGQASPKFYGKDPVGTAEGHAFGTANFLKLAAEKNVKCFLYFSSCDVYGDIIGQRIDENFVGKVDTLKLRSCYPLGKMLGENLCVAYAHQYGVLFKILRIAHTYGPMMPLNDGRVFADFVGNILNNKDISLNSDGSAVRPMLYISDAIRAYFRVLFLGKKNEAYNVASEEYTTILNLAQMLVRAYTEKNLKVTFDKKISQDYLQATTKSVVVVVDKLKSLGWSQKYSLREGFMRTIDATEI